MNGTEAAKPKAIDQTRVLVGEGVEEVLFFTALLGHLGISGVQVEHCNGKAGLGSYLKTLKTRTGFASVQKVAIVRDADEDPAAAAANVESFIARAGFPEGVIVSKLILPGASTTGALEHLCLRTIAGQPIATCIEEYLACATDATGIKHTSTTNQAKSRVQVWLAAQEPPDLRLGIAAGKGMLDWSSPAFDELKAFLRELA